MNASLSAAAQKQQQGLAGLLPPIPSISSSLTESQAAQAKKLFRMQVRSSNGKYNCQTERAQGRSVICGLEVREDDSRSGTLRAIIPMHARLSQSLPTGRVGVSMSAYMLALNTSWSMQARADTSGRWTSYGQREEKEGESLAWSFSRSTSLRLAQRECALPPLHLTLDCGPQESQVFGQRHVARQQGPGASSGGGVCPSHISGSLVSSLSPASPRPNARHTVTPEDSDLSLPFTSG